MRHKSWGPEDRRIRSLTLSEVERLLGWAAAEGWNPGLGDAAAFQAVDPDGFIGAFVNANLVAAIAAIAYDPGFGFIGLYICHPDWRGQGHGKAVWDAGMAHLGGRTMGLDAVPAQQPNYIASGFTPSYRTVRLTGVVKPSPLAQGSAILLDSGDDERVAAIDGQNFPAARRGFLWHWLAPPNQALAILAGDAVRSYGVVRPCTIGYRIGPLFAAQLSDARMLLQGLTGTLSGPVQIDVPVAQAEFIADLENLGFTPGFSTTRMYRGPAPPLVMDGVFGITSLELG